MTKRTCIVIFDDKDMSSLNEAQREKVRRDEMGFVFQSVALLPMMTAYENIDFAFTDIFFISIILVLSD